MSRTSSPDTTSSDITKPDINNPDMTKQALLEVDALHVSFFSDQGELQVVRNVSFDIAPGETVALVGESGCGKSVTALAIMGLIEPPGRITAGSLRLAGQELTQLSSNAYQTLRGKRIGMIFQEPMTSLNPVFTIGDQIAEVLINHEGMDALQAREESIRLLKQVGIPAPEQRIDQYPHELSGGMKQRVMIAMALACKPELLIADEPTTALDVTIQAQILRLLRQLQQELGMAILLITHNLGVVAQFAQRVVVMYAGEVAEQSDVRSLFQQPLHPYTRALLKSLPTPGRHDDRLYSIPGNVPMPKDFAAGCRFCTRCPEVLAHCASEVPTRIQQQPAHEVACWLFLEDAEGRQA